MDQKNETAQQQDTPQTTFQAASDYVTDCVNAVAEGLGIKEKSSTDKATEAAHKLTGKQNTPERLGDAASDAADDLGLKEKSKTEKATNKALDIKESVKDTFDDIRSSTSTDGGKEETDEVTAGDTTQAAGDTVQAAYDYVADCVTAVSQGLGISEKSTEDKLEGAKHKLADEQTTPERLGEAASDAAVSLGFKEESKTDKAVDKALSAKETIKEKASSAKEAVGDATESAKEAVSDAKAKEKLSSKDQE